MYYFYKCKKNRADETAVHHKFNTNRKQVLGCFSGRAGGQKVMRFFVYRMIADKKT